MAKDIYDEFGGSIRKCICGKEFIPTYGWVYKIKTGSTAYKYYCSYTCWRKAGGDSGKYKNRAGYTHRKGKSKM